MKTKTTNVLIIIATSLSFLCLFTYLLIYLGPQEVFFSFVNDIILGNNYDHFTVTYDPYGMISNIILFGLYLTACLVTVLNKTKKTGKITCLLIIIVLAVISIISPYISTYYYHSLEWSHEKYYSMSALNNLYSLIATPLYSASWILLCVTLGTLCGKEPKPQPQPQQPFQFQPQSQPQQYYPY